MTEAEKIVHALAEIGRPGEGRRGGRQWVQVPVDLWRAAFLLVEASSATTPTPSDAQSVRPDGGEG